MARDPAAQPNLENYEPVQSTPAGGYPGGATAYPPAPNPYLRSPLPPSQQTSVDQLRQFYRIGTPQNRTLPLQPNANPANNAAAQTVAQSVAETIINNGVAADVTLTMPVQYVVSGSPGDDLGVQWLPVPAGYALMGPGPIAALESISPASSGAGSTINASITPGSATSWALFVEYSDNNLVTPPPGWTAIHSTTSQNVYYLNVTGTTSVAINSALSAPTSYVAAVFGFAGPAPPIVQSAPGTIVGGSGGATLGAPVTAGNVLWVVAQAYDGATNFSINVSDSLNNELELISVVSVGPGLHPAQTQALFVAPSINTTGTDTVTIEYFGSINPPDHKEFLIFETGPLSPGPGLPFFRQISPSEIPSLENLAGILPINKGGTGETNPALVAGSGISITGTWPDQIIAASGGGGGTPSGSTGDVQVNNAGAFGTATDIQSGAGININSGSLEFTGGIGLAITNGPLSVLAGASGNIILRTNGNIQIDSNGANLLLGTTFSSGITLGGSASNIAFYGATRQPQATITGSRGGNAALASLLTNLATFGLIVDGTSP